MSSNCLGEHHYFSGTDAERLVDFQNALDDTKVDVILCARGGYGCIRIIDSLDFAKFRTNPKLVIGFSDVTVFHNHIHSHFNLPTVSCDNAFNFSTNTSNSLQSLVDVINGNRIQYKIEPNINNKLGHVKGIGSRW